MKIGIVSDSHGNIENLKKALEALRKEGAKFIAHLGDNYSDCGELFVNLVIPGVYDEEYEDRRIPHRVIKEFSGKKFLFTHSIFPHENDFENDINPQEKIARKEVNFVCFGHTHVPEIKIENDVVLVNPGHLKNEDKKGYPPSYAIIEINEKTIIKIKKLNGETIIEQLL